MAIDSKSLMLGDWVYRPDCYDQVKEIRAGGIIGADSLRGLIPFSQLEPIPLTPEILERIGFKVTEYPCYDDTCTDIEFDATMEFDDTIARVEIEYSDSTDVDIFVHKRNNLPPFRHIQIPIKYIHELQHALRLCNIEKKIEL